MAKNVTIEEGGLARRMNGTARMAVEGQDGETHYYVPEDERIARPKMISKNGTYYASDEGLYAFSKLTVNVYGGSAGKTVPTTTVAVSTNPATPDTTITQEIPNSAITTGQYTLPEGTTMTAGDPVCMLGEAGKAGTAITGKMSADDINALGGNAAGDRNVSLSVDGDGKVSVKVIPNAMTVQIPPYKTAYYEGETINFNGIVCMPWVEKNVEFWQDDRYPLGVIPFPELSFSVTVAHSGVPIASSDDGTVQVPVYSSMQRRHRKDSDWETVSAPPGGVLLISWSTKGGWKYCLASSQPFDGWYLSKTIKGLTVYCYFMTATAFNFSYYEVSPIVWNKSDHYTLDEAWVAVYGNRTGGQDIPVNWKSPYDGKTYTDSFKITVVAAQGGGGGGGGGSY